MAARDFSPPVGHRDRAERNDLGSEAQRLDHAAGQKFSAARQNHGLRRAGQATQHGLDRAGDLPALLPGNRSGGGLGVIGD